MPHPTRPLDDMRRQASAALLRLVSHAEVRSIAENFSMEPLIDRAAVIERLATLPRYQALAVLLRTATPTVLMLRDILHFLERQGVSARTTGCALMLADPAASGTSLNLELSPQAAGVICDWTAPALRKLGDDPWRQSLEMWRELVPGWRYLLRCATPQERPLQMDPVQSYITGRPQYSHPPALLDEAAQTVLAHLMHQVRALLETLKRTPQDGRSPLCVTLIEELSELVHAVEDVLCHDDPPPCRSELDERNDLERYVSAGFLEAFDRLREDILSLGDIARGDRIFDLIQADLWNSRPQLFEVWLLTSLLQWLADRGYDLQLLKLSTQPSGRCEWRLSYAKDAEPCARLSGRRDAGSVYFQRYQPGDMPDICFIPESGSDAQPLWVVDAKHSETGGYGLSHYSRAAMRYGASPGVRLSAVVEYFPRPDLTTVNPTSFGSHHWLVTDSSPSGSGLPILFGLLGAIHPSTPAILLCVDVSSSFESAVMATMESVCRDLRAGPEPVLDAFICFAGEAMTTSGLRAFVSNGGAGLRTALEDISSRLPLQSTLLEPLVRELRQVTSVRAVSRVVVISDGDFSDGVADPIQAIQSRLAIPVNLRNGRS